MSSSEDDRAAERPKNTPRSGELAVWEGRRKASGTVLRLGVRANSARAAARSPAGAVALIVNANSGAVELEDERL